MSGTARASLQVVALGAVVFLGACGSGGTGGAGGGGQGGRNPGSAGTTGSAGVGGAGGVNGSAGAPGAGGGAGAAGVAGSAGGVGGGGAGGAAGSGVAGQGGGSGHAISDGGVDAAPSVCGTGIACGGDLSNIGTADFCISFTLVTQAMQGETALLNQRSTCGFSNFWDIRAGLPAPDAGATASWIQFESDVDSTNDLSVGGPTHPVANLNDGRSHTIVVKRVSGVVTIWIDGISKAMGTLETSFAKLATLAVESDVCDGVDGTHAESSGSVLDVCITH